MHDGTGKTVAVARVCDAFGIKGQIKLAAYTQNPHTLLKYSHWELSISGRDNCCYSVSNAKIHGKFVVASLDGIENRDQALELKGAQVTVLKSELPQLDAGEYYWVDLIGMNVINSNGTNLGKVESIMETGANDVLVVEGEVTRLIPYVPHVIEKVSLDNEEIIVEWPEEFDL